MPDQQKPGGDTFSFSNVNLATAFKFNNQPLDNIFEQLEDMYQVRIIYSKPTMKRIYFIGTFNKSESVENILKQFAMLNELEVT